MTALLYEVHTDTGWKVRSSDFEVALNSAKASSLFEPRQVFRVSRLNLPDREWICSFHNGRLTESFLNTPEWSGVEA